MRCCFCAVSEKFHCWLVPGVDSAAARSGSSVQAHVHVGDRRRAVSVGALWYGDVGHAPAGVRGRHGSERHSHCERSGGAVGQQADSRLVGHVHIAPCSRLSVGLRWQIGQLHTLQRRLARLQQHSWRWRSNDEQLLSEERRGAGRLLLVGQRDAVVQPTRLRRYGDQRYVVSALQLVGERERAGHDAAC